MRETPRLVCLSLALLGVLTLAARGVPEDAERAPLDPGVITVRLLLGVGDRQPQAWSGRVTVDRGEVVGVEGWRFRAGDKVTGRDSWDARSLLIRKTAPGKKAAAKQAAAAKATGPGNAGPAVTATGVLVSVKAPADATLTVATEQGDFTIPLADLADGLVRRPLDGRVEAQRVPPYTPLVEGPDQEDFPAAAADAHGGVWVAYVVHKARGPEVSEAVSQRPKDFSAYVPGGGGDQIRLLRFVDGKPGEPLDVTGEGLDVWRPAVAVAGDGSVVVAWSENRDGNWDLYRRRHDPERSQWSEPKRLTTAPGADADVVLATAPDGRVWMAWQAWTDGPNEIRVNPRGNPGLKRTMALQEAAQADILLAPVEGAERPCNVSNSREDEWSPALAVDRTGRLHVAYDSYLDSYDVMLRSAVPDDNFIPPRVEADTFLVVAGSPRFEARPSLAIDPRGRVWVAYEERTRAWGKDAENLVDGEGSSLYRSGAVRVRCVDGGKLLEAPDPVASAHPSIQVMNGYPRLFADPSGRIGLLFRHRQEAIWGNNAVMVVGGVWIEYATALAGTAWSVPRPLPRSDGLLDNRPALVQPGDGPCLAVYDTDNRLHREVESTPDLQRRYYTHSGTPPGVVNNDLMVAALAPARTEVAVEPVLRPVRSGIEEARDPVHPDEPADVARMRAHRIQAGGRTYQLLRGEFHRHTEISQDGGNDGSLEDMWRYALDAAKLDWIGNGDHDNGGGKEYTWWLIQKTTDLYHNPPAFVPMFTYERSVGYPGGHRNVMFPRRGVRTLPRLVDENGVRTDVRGVDEDAAMLHAYLNEIGGICAAHTSATGMGTDWRANDPKAEPFVEIFQGHRNSYEHLGAPRVARRPSEAIGGFKPLGMIWNALAMQYKLGFQASSDHISTHISFAVAIAEQPTRAAIFDAFQRRHCYGTTDNILLDVRCGEHLMGDEFASDGPVTLKILAHGTGPIARVDVIKDFVHVFSTEPHAPRVEFSWTDEERRPPGLSWYYVRVLQDDGEIAWGSPMWVTRGDPKPSGSSKPE